MSKFSDIKEFYLEKGIAKNPLLWKCDMFWAHFSKIDQKDFMKLMKLYLADVKSDELETFLYKLVSTADMRKEPFRLLMRKFFLDNIDEIELKNNETIMADFIFKTFQVQYFQLTVEQDPNLLNGFGCRNP